MWNINISFWFSERLMSVKHSRRVTTQNMPTCINYCVSLNRYHQRADVTSKAVVEVINKTSEYLQPNPATRAKLSMLNTVSKIRGQVKSPGYPQPEGLLGECMTKYGRDMGDDTNFGKNSIKDLKNEILGRRDHEKFCMIVFDHWVPVNLLLFFGIF